MGGRGEGVNNSEPGELVGVEWFSGTCGQCGAYRRCWQINCEHLPVPGITLIGGYVGCVLVHAKSAGARARRIRIV